MANNNSTINNNVSQTYIDLTKTGPLTYRQLRSLNNNLPEETPANALLPDNPGIQRTFQEAGKVNYLPHTGLGESMFDPEVTNIHTLEHLSDYRANAQPAIAKLGAGLAKGAILAGTTFLNGIVGTVLGAGEAFATGDASRLWDNEFSRAMKAINDWSEEVMPNYYSHNELISPWYSNILTPNFIGDKFIKNLGFSIGALYSGGLFTAGLNALKVPNLIGKITSILGGSGVKAAKMTTSALGGLFSAVGEGSIEAINNSKDWSNLKTQELDDLWANNIRDKYAPELQQLTDELIANASDLEKRAEIEARIADLQGRMNSEFELRKDDPRYIEALTKIEEDRKRMGNMDLLFNIPILTMSNMVQFTKFYARGFDTARRSGVKTVGNTVTGTVESAARRGASTEIVDQATRVIDKYAGRKLTKLGGARRILQGALSEGTEEISQKAASLVAGDYYGTDVSNYFAQAKIDPEAEQETLDWVKSFGRGINETLNDSSSWEEFFIGALTGVLGVPTFRSIRNSEGKLQSPIKIQGGAWNEWKEYKAEIERSHEIAKYLNERVQSPDFLNYYRGIIRHNRYQKDMNAAVENDDEFEFKTAEFAQFVSDIIMFDNGGKLSDLEEYIKAAADGLTDEDLQSIVDNTTTTTTDPKTGVTRTEGPFIDKKGNSLLSTEEGKAEMREKLMKSRNGMLKTINEYRKAKNEIDVATNGMLTDEQLAELTYLKMQRKDWMERASTLAEELKPTINTAVEGLNRILENLDEEDIEELGISEETKFRSKLAGKKANKRNSKKSNNTSSTDSNISEESQEDIEESSESQTSTENREDVKNTETSNKDTAGSRSSLDSDKRKTARQNIKKAIDWLTKIASSKSSLASFILSEKGDVLSTYINIGLQSSMSSIEDIIEAEKKLRDIPKLMDAAKKFNSKLEEFLKDPKKVEEHLENAEREVADKIKNDKTTSLKESLSQAKNLKDFRDILDKEDDIELKEKTLRELRDKGHKLAQDYGDVTSYSSDVTKAINNMSESATDKENALALFRNLFNNSSDLKGLSNKNSIFITDNNVIYDDRLSDEENQTRFAKAMFILQQAMGKVNEDAKFKNKIASETVEPSSKTKPNPKAPSSDTTGNSDTTTTDTTTPGNSGGKHKPTNPDVPVGDITDDEVKEDIKEINDNSPSSKEVDNQSGDGKKQYYRPVIPKFHIEGSKRGDFRPFPVVVKELEGKDFDEIYRYLAKKGAFDFVDNGGLKVGDKILFMIDPNFNDHTIFMVHADTGTVIGSLDESKLGAFEGLKTLTEKVRQEYKEFKERSETPKTYTEQRKEVYNEAVSGGNQNGRVISVSTENLPSLVGVKKGPITIAYPDGTKATGYITELSGMKGRVYQVIDKDGDILVENGKVLTKEEVLKARTESSNGILIKNQHETAKNGRTRDTRVSEVSRISDEKNGLITVSLEEEIIGDSEKPELIGRKVTGGLDLDLDTIDWERMAYSNATTADGRRITREDITAEDIEEQKQIIDDIYTREDGSRKPIKVNKIIYAKDGTIIARTPDGTSFFLKRDPLNTNQNNGGTFIASPFTRVSKIMVGKVAYTEEENNLYSIFVEDNNGGEQKDSSKKKSAPEPIFGIVKNGRIVTNDKIVNYDDIIKPMNMDGKEGRLYLLIPNPAGKYTPVAVRVKHLNSNEVSDADIAAAFEELAKAPEERNTTILTHIAEAAKQMVLSNNEPELKSAVGELIKYLYKNKHFHINFKESKTDKPNSILLTRAVLDANGNEIWENGKRKEEDPVWINLDLAKSADELATELIKGLMQFNLPFQVNTGSINTGGYNRMLINSGILTSNIASAEVQGNWFTTDYIDDNGNIQSAINPKSRQPKPTNPNSTSPVDGQEGVGKGNNVTIDGATYTVDTVTGDIFDSNGNKVNPDNAELIQDIAWADANFGSATNSSVMWNNKIITPSGRVLNRSTNQYLTGAEAQEVFDKVNGNTSSGSTTTTTNTTTQNTPSLEELISKVNEAQDKVDRSRTDKDYYYILEEDGQYHPYDRVHKRIGSNSTGTSNNAGSELALEMGSAVDSVVRDFFRGVTPTRPAIMSESAFNSLLDQLAKIKQTAETRGEKFMTDNVVIYHKYPDGTRIAGEVDILSIDKNGKVRIYDVKTSKRSFSGKDSYFEVKASWQTMSTKDYYTLQLSAYKNLFENQFGIPVQSLGILPFVLSVGSNELLPGSRKKMGLLSRMGEGKFFIRNDRLGADDTEARYEYVEKDGVLYFIPIVSSSMLSSFKSSDILKETLKEAKGSGAFSSATNLVVLRPGKAVKDAKGNYIVEELPIVFAEDDTHKASVSASATISSINKEGGISITYNPNVNVPKDSKAVNISNDATQHNTAATTTSTKTNTSTNTNTNTSTTTEATSTNETASLPIFSDSIESLNPIDEVIDDAMIEGGSIGYYERGGKIYKSYLAPIGNVNNVEIYLAKVPNYTQKRSTGEKAIATIEYYVVFPNGVSVLMRTAMGAENANDEEAKKAIMEALNRNPTRVINEASKKTSISEAFSTQPAIETQSESTDEILPDNTPQAEVSNEATDILDDTSRINGVEDEEDGDIDDIINNYRKAQSEVDYPLWNKEEELAWLEKVLPQLSREDRIRIKRGLLRVAESGGEAWGAFTKGIMILSDIAAEGTVYHEAFHVVFNLLLSQSEREGLLEEAAKKFGEKSAEDLEEDLAEDFREYVMSRSQRGLGQKILDFFKDLFAKVTNWKYVKPTMNNYFRMINQGRYANKEGLDSADVKFRLVGEKGAARYDKTSGSSFMYSLSIAKAMEKEGKSPKAIKWATGWERGAEGKWRLERPDIKFVDSLKVTLSDGRAVISITDIIKDKELFEMYPEIAKVKVTFAKLEKGVDGSAAGYDIDINIKYLVGPLFNREEYDKLVAEEEELVKTPEFEDYYKFSNSNPSEEAITEYIRTHPTIQKLEGITNRIAELNRERRNTDSKTLSVDLYEGLKEVFVHELQHVIQREEGFATGGSFSYGNKDSYNGYFSLAGEVEARNVSRRMKLSWADRYRSTAASTEDVSREEQIYGSRNDIRYRRITRGSNTARNRAKGKSVATSFAALDSREKNALKEKGWTAEKFDSISQIERDQVMMCLAI